MNNFGIVHELADVEKRIRSEVNAAASHLHNVISGLEQGGLTAEQAVDLLKKAQAHLANVAN